ncbi:MAG: HAD hydrolase-like protein [Clostridia bacterium]|nr:HAD hydrolase-like protein [Clostridia bacterium]
MNTILFDLDGTLTDPYEGITKSILYALEQCQVFDDDPQKLRSCIGPPLTYSFSEIYHLPEDRIGFAVRKYRERYGSVGWAENIPLDGVLPMLDELKKAGFRMAVASSKPKPFVDKILDKFGMTKYMDAVVGSGLDGSLNSKTLVIEEAMRLLGAEKEDCVMVGDRKHDAEGAKACSLPCIGILTGYAEEGELERAGATYVVSSFRELTTLLLSLQNKKDEKKD